MLVASDGFCLASIKVELSKEDKESYLIPFEHLYVARQYLMDYENVEVTKKDKTVSYKTVKATITADFETTSEFPNNYMDVVKTKDPEYVVRISTDLLQKLMVSHRKLGNKYVSLKMSGSDKPIFLETELKDVISILMPVRVTDDDELGKLQKKVK